MPALVDYDPFAAPAPKPKAAAAPKPKLVAGDPFAWADPEKAIEGAVGEPVRVTSTRRSAAHNAAVGGSRTSSHMSGQAADFIPQDGNLDAAAARLAGSKLPYDQVIREGDHVHVGWGPKARRQAIGTTAAAEPKLVEGDPFAPVPAPKPKPAVGMPTSPPKLVAHDPFKAVKDYVGEVIDRNMPATDRSARLPKSWKDAPAWLMDRATQGLNEGAGSVMGAPAALFDAAVSKPVTKAETALLGPGKEFDPKAKKFVPRDPKAAEESLRRGNLNAFNGLGAGEFAKIPDFGPGWKMPAKIRAPKEPLFADDAFPATRYQLTGKRKTVAGVDYVEAHVTSTAGGSHSTQFLPVSGQHANAALARAVAPKEPGPIYGAEPKRPERVDNALHRVRTNETADKLRATQSRAKVRKALGDQDQAEGENLTHELEQALVDPKRKLSERAEQALTHVSKLKDQQTADMNAIRKLAAKHGGDVEDYLGDQGHVPRRVVGKARGFDDQLVDHPDPITGRGLALNKTTSALKGRAPWRMLQPKGGGDPIWVDGKTAVANPERYEKLGTTLKGSGGKTYTVRQPTIAEIEQHTAGTDHETSYHKNYFDLIHDDWVRVRQVRRNLEVLDSALSDLKGQGLAHRVEHMRPVETKSGATVMTPQRSSKPTPEGFVELPHIKQLKGWAFSPEIAEVFKDYKPGPGSDAAEVLSKVNGTLTSSLFWNPLPHTWNVANDWAKARGVDWAPGRGGYSSLIRNGAKAVHAVITKGETYQELLREGASLMGADQDVRNFHEVMLNKGVKQLQQEKGALSMLMHSFDLKGLAPQKLIASIYKAAGHALWNESDVLMIQRVLELKDRGLDTRAAIKLAEKDIASYRVPSRVLQNGKMGRAVSELTRNSNVLLFGRYHYGMLKSWGTMFKDLYAGKPEERTEAAGKLIAAMIIVHGVYPMLDQIAQKVTGEAKARVHRGGGLGLADAGEEFSKGQKEWMALMGRLISTSPALNVLQDVKTGADVFGQKIVNPQAKTGEKVAELGEHAAGYVSPVGEALQTLKPGGGKRVLARNLLVDIPSDKAERGKKYGKQRDKKAAVKRRRNDGIVRAAGDLFK